MKKKISVDQLKPGMFVQDFNCSWFEHPFFGSSKKIRDKKIIDKIVDSGIREVYIDTDRGSDAPDAVTEEEVNQEIQTEIRKIAESKINEGEGIEDTEPVAVEEELVKAKEIKKEAIILVHTMMQDIRFGRQIKTEHVEPVVEKMIDSIFRNKNALTSLSRIKTADEYTFLHSVSVGVQMIAFGKYLDLDLKILKSIGMGGVLHDVGKMKVPAEILNKRGQLTEEEFLILKEHVNYGCEILEQVSGIDETARSVVAQHHERVDGSGYPNALTCNELNLYGQMASIVDIYDALTSERCYKDKILPTDALRKIFEWGNVHFNSKLVQHFIRCVGIYPVGTFVSLESGLIGAVVEHNEKSLLEPVIRVFYDTKNGNYLSAPYTIDLSQSSINGVADKIVTHESHHRLGINPDMCLQEG
jgi:putative nucleotidyltransferase with HDIG domain